MAPRPFTLPPVDQILVSASPGELRIASLRAGRAWVLLIARDHRPSLVGNVYLGRVRRVEPGLNAAFVDIGLAEAGFLAVGAAPHRGGITGRVHEGETLLVQIVRDAFDDKGPALSTRIALPGRHLVFTPRHAGVTASRRMADPDARRRLQGLLARLVAEGEGVILRTAAAHASDGLLTAELAALRASWIGIAAALRPGAEPGLVHADLPFLTRFLRDGLPPRPVPVLFDDRLALAEARRFAATHAPELADELAVHDGGEPLLEAYGVEAEIDQAVDGEWPLPSGGRLTIEATRALTAIDVDTARASAVGKAEQVMLAANLEAAVEAARAIRFGNIAGLIVVDFPNMPAAEHRARVAGTVRAAFADDPAEMQIADISRLGLLEMSRQRLAPSLWETLTAACPACAGAGRRRDPESTALDALRALLRTSASTPGTRPAIAAAPPVLAALRGGLAAARSTTEARLGMPIELRAQTDALADRFTVATG